MFIPRSSLASISCGRGPGGSRFVDMMVQLDEEEGNKKPNKAQNMRIAGAKSDKYWVHADLVVSRIPGMYLTS